MTIDKRRAIALNRPLSGRLHSSQLRLRDAKNGACNTWG